LAPVFFAPGSRFATVDFAHDGATLLFIVLFVRRGPAAEEVYYRCVFHFSPPKKGLFSSACFPSLKVFFLAL